MRTESLAAAACGVGAGRRGALLVIEIVGDSAYIRRHGNHISSIGSIIYGPAKSERSLFWTRISPHRWRARLGRKRE